MIDCSLCRSRLAAVPGLRSATWVCPNGHGRALTLAAARRSVGEPFVKELWLRARSSQQASSKRCGSCHHPMRVVTTELDGESVELDVCLTCQIVWFDTGEYRQQEEPEDRLHPEAKAALMELEVAQARRASAHDHDLTPDQGWKTIAGFFGLPVEMNTHTLTRTPIVTWGLLAVIAMVSLLAMSQIHELAPQFGFVPDQALRARGVTALTTLLFHADYFHLFGNLYFLWIFGDDVESHTGHWRFLGLFLLATLLGSFTHAFTTQQPDLPLIGASGGIAGILVYYGLRFPRVRIGTLLPPVYTMLTSQRLIWLRMNAIWALGFWIVLQLIGLRFASDSISYGGHIGGALAGGLFFLLEQLTSEPAVDRGRKRVW